jgi:hypothetical protein
MWYTGFEDVAPQTAASPAVEFQTEPIEHAGRRLDDNPEMEGSMVMKRMLSWWKGLVALASVVVFGLVGLIGCGRPTATPTSSIPEVELPFHTIERRDFGAEFYDSDQPCLAIVSQPADIEPLQNIISVDAQASLRGLDFKHELAIVVFRGLTDIFYPESGVEVQRIVRQGSTITVFAVFHGPTKGYETIPIENSPYHAITIERNNDMHGEFFFILTVDGTVRTRQTYRFP